MAAVLALLAAGHAAADPWAAPVDPADEAAHVRCAALYTLFSAAYPPGGVRDDMIRLRDAVVAMLDARDRLDRGLPIVARPEPSEPLTAAIEAAFNRYGQTLRDGPLPRGFDDPNAFLRADLDGCAERTRLSGRAPGFTP